MNPQEDQIKALTARDAYGALGLEDDPELAFAGIRALRQMADFCESYQVRRLHQAGHTWAEIARGRASAPRRCTRSTARALRDSEASSE
jgi:hypothetical protein